MVKELEINGMTKYAKIAFIAEKGVFPIFSSLILKLRSMGKQ